MCGIAGYLSDELPPDPAVVKLMCDKLVHRGPDDYGWYRDSQAALGHRRLSIIDVDGGHQPLANEDGSLQVVFDGEIYNYRELRRDLISRGHRFATRSDTEVLVHLYEEAGERLPEYLNGMFAFTIWDIRRQELFLARDRFGKKPLYYSSAVPGVRFCFASELKALAALPGFDPQVEPQSVADFLSLSYVPDPATIYKNVFKLRPGHSLTVGLNSETSRRYWKLRFSAEDRPDFSKAVREIQDLASDAIERRMISDVPLGAFLSGGVDSSAVVALMAAHAPDRVKTFSIGFTEEKCDELRFARMVAGRYQTDHHERVVSPSVYEMLDTQVEHFDEPFADASAIPTLYLARMTRQHVKVALSGDGADEVFGGYRRYRFGVLEHRLRQRLPRWFRESVIRTSAQLYPKFDYLPQAFRAKTLLTNLSQQIGDAYFASMSVFRDGALGAILAPELRRTLGTYSPRESFRERFARVAHLDPLGQMQAVDFETYLPGDILVKADRATMAYSLESRSPWLDYRLVELAARLPPGYKIRGASGKYIFKEAMRALLPADVLDRSKMGFSVPLSEWFRTKLRPTFEEAVLSGSPESLVSLTDAKRLWREHQSGAFNHERKLWSLLMLSCWMSAVKRAAGSGRFREMAASRA
jgi:asparagine synthase (glutamine-hydrolysing)